MELNTLFLCFIRQYFSRAYYSPFHFPPTTASKNLAVSIENLSQVCFYISLAWRQIQVDIRVIIASCPLRMVVSLQGQQMLCLTYNQNEMMPRVTCGTKARSWGRIFFLGSKQNGFDKCCGLYKNFTLKPRQNYVILNSQQVATPSLKFMA